MIVDVAIPFRVFRTFHYLIDEAQAESLGAGSVLQVPFGKRKIHGFVVDFPEESDIDPKKLKSVDKVLVERPLADPEMFKLLKWISDYYCHPLGEVMSAALPKSCWDVPAKRRKTGDDVVTAKFDGLEERPTLTEEQEFAVSRILDPEEKRPILLHGVTGSGKTEVYMHVLEKTVEQGKGAIILAPEIALTPQLVDRFSKRFPDQLAVLHSDLTPRERSIQWQRVYQGKAKIVIGARSAIFAPVQDLGLIVVDEEHEPSFKQEDSLRYHARDVAVVRGQLTNARVILGSATPSLESYANADAGKYLRVSLTQRIHKQAMPKATFVDLKEKENIFSYETPWLTHQLKNKIDQTIADGQQVLLYLNRLGYAHFLFCKDCAHTWSCKDCDVSLTYYQSGNSLKCHYCGAFQRAPQTCPECKSMELEAMGVGTEQVEESLKKILPNARIARMDRSVIKTRKSLESLLKKIADRQIDVVIGTQMIAKGHDFPGIVLVGILVADASLNVPDFRANERTFQLITQVSGRAGRAEIPGEVYIQTINVDHPVLRAAAEHRPMEFYDRELSGRKQFGFPPAQRLVLLRFQHTSPQRVQQFAQEMAFVLEKNFHGRFELMGPSEAPLSRVKKLYRWHCLLKSESVRTVQQLVRMAHQFHEHKKTMVGLAVDVDPMHLM